MEIYKMNIIDITGYTIKYSYYRMPNVILLVFVFFYS